MIRHQRKSKRPANDSGMSLYLVIGSMIGSLGFLALAVDLGSYYVARSQAQRAADAAALAGAGVFVSSACTASSVNPCSSTTVETLASNEAITVGNQNLVGGQSAALSSDEITFNTSNINDPQITVKVERTSAHGNPMPTYFAKIIGFTAVNVSATSTAEAYNPSGTSGAAPLGMSCVKPWVLPNCDTAHTSPANSNCTGAGYYIDPTTGAIEHPGPVSQGGVIGMPLTLKPGDPSQAPVPSQFYAVQMCLPPSMCPYCSGNVQTGCTGASVYNNNIECCNSNLLVCGGPGTVDLQLQTGNMQGPTQSGTECLINEDSSLGTGQDTLCGTSVLQPGVNASCAPNFTYYGGSNNPNPALVGKQITSSNSVINIPLYDGHNLCSGQGNGNGCNPDINIIGILQVFVNQVDVDSGQGKGTVYATLMNISACSYGTGGGTGGAGGSGSSGSVSGGGVSAIPVRLVQAQAN